MKKLAFLLALLTLLTAIPACSSQKKPSYTGAYNGVIDEAVLTTGEEWFSKSGLVPGMSQFAFQAWLEKFTFEGKTLIERIQPQFFYDNSGRGFRGDSYEYNYNCITAAALVEGRTSFSYSLTTSSTIGGLSLPWGVEIGDTLSESLTKMGIEIDLAAEFKPDSEESCDMIVLTSDTTNLVFTDFTADNQETSYLYYYTITFTYSTSYEKVDGSDVDAVSSITLSYDQDSKLSTVVTAIHELTER